MNPAVCRFRDYSQQYPHQLLLVLIILCRQRMRLCGIADPHLRAQQQQPRQLQYLTPQLAGAQPVESVPELRFP